MVTPSFEFEGVKITYDPRLETYERQQTMNDPLINRLNKYLKDGARCRAHSYNVSADLFVAVVTRLRDDEKTIETLHGLLHIARIKTAPAVTREITP